MSTGNKVHIIEENDTLPVSANDYFNLNVNADDFSRIQPLRGINKKNLIIDKAAYTVYLEGNKIDFPKKEFELLLFLASNPRKVFRRIEILRQIWGFDFKPKDSRSLDVHIRMLRKKLNDRFITTIRGVGYKLEK